MKEKQIARKKFLEKRKTLTKKEIMYKSHLIEKNLFAFEKFINSKNIMFFVSFGKEPFTHEIINKSFSNKTVLIPKVFGDNLISCRINSLKELRKGAYGIPEPMEENFFSVKKIDCVLVPGLAFSIKGERIGYGKGYFDRFLEKTIAYRIGTCFDEFVTEKIVTDQYDVNVDAIVTDKRLIVVNK